ncbi:hypothetical protein AWZ03_007817 [Drosophila navojoa]|uniref:Uncharacterized protein n=1 Tax=Drosophila navojoa TaxID=7232 RepID=A0A484BAG0_DRONA|nr:uncharacterized protein LOC108651443 [Drosophila navojoa]TDG45783.1 hypothetical protein AWZ03_007817 [Drosophila navojoa]
MLKVPQRNKLPSLTPRPIKIERPTPRKKLNFIKPAYVMPKKPTRSEEIANMTAELNERLITLQARVAEWKALRENKNE